MNNLPAEFQPFQMERWMSLHEQDVEYNLSESGVHPITLRELLEDDPDRIASLLDLDLNYPWANGTPELRRNVAALYRDARPENVLVTVGAAEANYIAIRSLLSPGDEIAIMLPNYMQIWGIAKNHGLGVREFHLREERGWALDLDELEEAVTERTRLIAVCNPNNPTGRALDEAEMDAIVRVAEHRGAWILSDEVYRGAERVAEEETPSFYGRYDRVLAIGSLSKAYGLPGLRLGWVAGPSEVLEEIWARHEYTTIAATRISNELAAIALSPEVRPRLIGRARDYIRRGFPMLEQWMKEQGERFRFTAPDASAIAFLHYDLDINSTELTQRLREEKSVLVVPGDHFGMDHFLRVSFGLPKEILEPAFDRIREILEQ
jgi:aspartate/methionine/tyrosine aminotransferase